MIDICFVCTGDTCRSVMAERIARKKAKEKGLDINFSSAGLLANDENISQNAKKALKQLGYDDSDRKSVLLDRINPTTLYVCVTDAHKKWIKSNRVLSFRALAGEVVDPYGKDLKTYIDTAKQIEKNVDVLLDKIEKLRGDL